MKILKDKNKKSKSDKDLKKVDVKQETKDRKEDQEVSEVAFSGKQSADAYKVLRNLYVSEKASTGISMNQYVFRVFERANKSEVKKEVAKMFNVKVKQVRMLNMPKKRRDLGKRPGFKPGFKKAIVVLEEGYAIGQAKP